MKLQIKLFKTLPILIVLLNMVPQVAGVCTYSQQYLDNEWSLMIKYENETLQLLREPKVENNAKLYLVCNSDNIAETTCIDSQFSPQIANTACGNYMLPQLKLENNYKLCPFNLYRVGYQIYCRDNNYFFETYKVCFDFDRKRAVFTIGEAYPFVKSRPFGMQFDPDEIFTMNIFSAYNKRDIYATFERILGPGQPFMPNNAGDERIDRGHLTPAGDFFTNTLIGTTFKMINVIPQFHTINDGNWKKMEEWARSPINTPAKVCSGALSWVLKLPDKAGNLREIYLRNNLIPIPLWTYKIVRNRDGIRTAFLQYNNIHDKQMPPQIPNGICEQTSCPSNIELVRSNYRGYTFCCNPDHFIANSVSNLRGEC